MPESDVDVIINVIDFRINKEDKEMKKGFHEVRIQKCNGIEECKVLNPGDVDRFDSVYCFKGTTVHIQLHVLDGVIIEKQDVTIEALRQKSLITDTNLTSETNGNIVVIKFTMPDNAVIVNIQPQYIVDPSKKEISEKYDNKHKLFNLVSPNGVVMFADQSTFRNSKDDAGCYIEYKECSNSEIINFHAIPDKGYIVDDNISLWTAEGSFIEKLDFAEDSSCSNIIVSRLMMPDHDVSLRVDFIKDNSSSNEIVNYFEIPDELARELSELLTKQTIRERLLAQLLDDPIKYEKAESMLIPVTSKIEAIKVKITKQYVPSKYNSTDYMWNYDGYEVDKNKVQIIKVG